MRELDEDGKSGLTTVDLSLLMTAVHLGPQKNWRIDGLSNYPSMHQIRRYEPSNVRSSYMCPTGPLTNHRDCKIYSHTDRYTAAHLSKLHTMKPDYNCSLVDQFGTSLIARLY